MKSVGRVVVMSSLYVKNSTFLLPRSFIHHIFLTLLLSSGLGAEGGTKID